jgi:hypothetical protein
MNQPESEKNAKHQIPNIQGFDQEDEERFGLLRQKNDLAGQGENEEIPGKIQENREALSSLLHKLRINEEKLRETRLLQIKLCLGGYLKFFLNELYEIGMLIRYIIKGSRNAEPNVYHTSLEEDLDKIQRQKDLDEQLTMVTRFINRIAQLQLQLKGVRDRDQMLRQLEQLPLDQEPFSELEKKYLQKISSDEFQKENEVIHDLYNSIKTVYLTAQTYLQTVISQWQEISVQLQLKISRNQSCYLLYNDQAREISVRQWKRFCDDFEMAKKQVRVVNKLLQADQMLVRYYYNGKQ